MDLDELLPSPAEVHCLLAQDIELRLRALFDLMNVPLKSEVVRQVTSYRDDRFLHKLKAIIPAEVLGRSTRQGELDLDDVIASRPYIEAMYAMETARALDDVQRELRKTAEDHGAAG
ncbi:hypothetical protein [Streptomyces asoensis]|uniref:hypothetical protein n=1 Tax=Streptomyces asoensis TaxID=249586 RepID=UPI0033D5560E